MAKGVKVPLLADGAMEPRQERSKAKRQTILDEARRLFAEKGYEQTSINDIAAATDIALGAFYVYFESKRQLLIVLMNQLLERLGAIELTPSGTLTDFLKEIFVTDLAYYGVIRAWQEASLTDPELNAWRTRIEQWTDKRILRVFTALNQRPENDLPTFARMMDRHFWDLLGRAGAMSARARDRELEVTADVISRYLFADVIKRAPR